MKEETEKLSLAIEELRRPSGRLWDEFVAALRAYSSAVDTQCISAPLEQLAVAQGRAREARELLRIIERAPGVAETLTRNRK